jgi:hypothetical protein
MLSLCNKLANALENAARVATVNGCDDDAITFKQSEMLLRIDSRLPVLSDRTCK